MTSMSFARSCPLSTSLSTRFLLHPRVMMLTLSRCSVFVFMKEANLRYLCLYNCMRTMRKPMFSGASHADRLFLQAEEGVSKLVFIEYQQVFHLLSYSYKFDRDPELVGDCQHHSAFGRTIQ